MSWIKFTAFSTCSDFSFPPLSNGADQIKPCQQRGLTGGWCCVGNVAGVPWWHTPRLWGAGTPSLLRACRLWPSKAGRIVGEGRVGSTRASRRPPRTPAPWLLNPPSSHKKTDRMKPHIRGPGRCAWGAASFMCRLPCLRLGSRKGGSRQSPPVPPLWKTEKGQKNRREGRACLTCPGREGRGLGRSGLPHPAGLGRGLGKRSPSPVELWAEPRCPPCRCPPAHSMDCQSRCCSLKAPPL